MLFFLAIAALFASPIVGKTRLFAGSSLILSIFLRKVTRANRTIILSTARSVDACEQRTVPTVSTSRIYARVNHPM